MNKSDPRDPTVPADQARGTSPSPPARRKMRLAAAVIVAVAAATSGGLVVWRFGKTSIEVPIPAQLASFDNQVQSYMKGFIDKAQAAPKDPGAHARLGLVYAAHRLWPEARACFANAARLDARQPLAPYHEANALIEMGEFDAALTKLAETTRSFPTFTPAHHRLGLLYLEQGDGERAAQAFERVIALSSESALGYAGLGETKLRARENAEALVLLEKAVAINPDDRKIQFLLGTAYLRAGRSAEAQQCLTRGAGAQQVLMADEWSQEQKSHGMTIADQIERALMLQEAARPADGSKILENALQWHPDSFSVMNNLAIMYIGMNQYDRARDVLVRAVEINDARFETFLNLAIAKAALQDMAGALEAADRATSLGPRVAHTHLVRANLLMGARRFPEALTAFEEAFKYDADDLAIHAGLASLYYRFGRLAEAREHFGRLTRDDPSNLGAQVRLCDICIKLGDLEGADRAFTAAQRLNAQHPDVIQLAQLLEATKGK